MAALLLVPGFPPSVDSSCAADAELNELLLRPDSVAPVHWSPLHLVAALPKGFLVQMESLAAIEQEETFRHFANSVFSAILILMDPRVLANPNCHWTLLYP